MHALEQEDPSRVRRALHRGLIVLGWGTCFAVAFHTDSIVVVRAATPSSLDRLLQEGWFLPAALASASCLAAAVWLLLAAPSAPRPAAPRSSAAALARGLALCVLLSAALALYLACGGHDLLYTYAWTPVGSAALVAPLLGLLSLVETGRASSARARLGWSALAGAGAFVALLLAWIQREYVLELFMLGVDSATQRVVQQLGWLSVDPLWTLLHFAWISLPVGSLTFARLRPRGERTWLALACSGAVVPWVIPFTPFADAVIVTSCALLCALTPLAWALGDRAHAQVVAWILDDAPNS